MESVSNLTRVSGLTVNSPQAYRFFGVLCVLAVLAGYMLSISALRSAVRGRQSQSERLQMTLQPTWLLEVGARLVQRSTPLV